MSGVDDQRRIDEAEQKAAIDFLEYFFQAASSAMGPADHDIYCAIMEDYESDGKVVPHAYRLGYLTSEDEFEDDGE